MPIDANITALMVGMVNLDVVVEGFLPEMGSQKNSWVDSISFRTGGDAQNCAMTAARLGVRNAISACVGHDHAGSICRSEMEKAGVDCSWLRTKPGRSGICLDLLTPGGEAMFVYNPGVNTTLSMDDVAWDILATTKVMSLHSFFNSGTLALDEVFRRARACGTLTVADAIVISADQRREDIFPALPHLDYFMPSQIELEQISGCSDLEAGARRLVDMGVGNVVVKLGDKGCMFVNATTILTVPGYDVDVVDTTGAGDNFVAGFIYGLTRDLPIERCLIYANACGALAVGGVGSNGIVRSIQQVDDFIDRHQPKAL